MKWRPLFYRSPSRQPRQAVAQTQYSNVKCVSRLRTTLYNEVSKIKKQNSVFHKNHKKFFQQLETDTDGQTGSELVNINVNILTNTGVPSGQI